MYSTCIFCSGALARTLEVRGEAVEEAERAFREARLRTATEHIGLARLREGTELVRIGQPMLPEFAA